MNDAELVDRINQLVLECGKVALDYYSKPVKQSIKPDQSIVSEADQHIEQIIQKELKGLLPDSHFIGEETCDQMANNAQELFERKYLWAVDPIDGTVNFVSHYGDWGISVGLMKKGEKGHAPFLGAVYIPLKDQLYYTDSENSFVVNKASTANPVKKKLDKIEYEGDDDLKQRIFAVNEGKISKYNFKGIKNIRVPGSTVVQFISTAAGESIGTISSGHIWDIAASLAVGQPLGVKMYDMKTGEETKEYTADNFVTDDVKNNWKMKKDYFASNDSAKEYLMKTIK